MWVWKLLVAAALVVPPAAYVAGTLSAADPPVGPREVVRLPTADRSVEPPTVIRPEPVVRATPRPDDDCDDDSDDDDIDMIRPCPDDLDDDDEEDDRDDDDDD